MSDDPVVIVGAARTPQGAFQGELSSLTAAELGAAAIRAALSRAGLDAAAVSETLMGCVLPAGQGQAPARQAAIRAGIPESSGATTINKMCGSGMKAVMLGHDLIQAGSADIVVAGGMESMTNAPYLLEKARGGYRMGHGRVLDHMFLDGLEDAYEKGTLMGVFADRTAEKYQITRADQDAFAMESLKRAQENTKNGTLESEIVKIKVKIGKEELEAGEDEGPKRAKPDKIPQLKPAFTENGTVTAANASSISDGAAALVLMKRSEAERRSLQILAKISGHATHARAPEEFTIAPIGAIEGVLSRTGWSKSDVGLYEINEAFAVVTLAAMKDLGLSHEAVNVYGGACALGHPIGASGARILVTLLNAMERRDVRRGVAALCIGGGEGTALALERP